MPVVVPSAGETSFDWDDRFPPRLIDSVRGSPIQADANMLGTSVYRGMEQVKE